MATLTPVQSTAAGAALGYAAATVGGDSIATTGRSNVKFLVRNGSGASITVTLTGVQKCSRGFLHDTIVTVAAGADETITIPGDTIDPVTGNVAVTYSAVTTVTVTATY
jgi:hypothetical protein